MKQQVYEEALKRIVEIARKDALNPRALLSDIDKLATAALGLPEPKPSTERVAR